MMMWKFSFHVTGAGATESDISFGLGGGTTQSSYGRSSPVIENVGSYHVVVSGIVGGSSLVSRISYGLIYITKKILTFALRTSTSVMRISWIRVVMSFATIGILQIPTGNKTQFYLYIISVE